MASRHIDYIVIGVLINYCIDIIIIVAREGGVGSRVADYILYNTISRQKGIRPDCRQLDVIVEDLKVCNQIEYIVLRNSILLKSIQPVLVAFSTASLW